MDDQTRKLTPEIRDEHLTYGEQSQRFSLNEYDDLLRYYRSALHDLDVLERENEELRVRIQTAPSAQQVKKLHEELAASQATIGRLERHVSDHTELIANYQAELAAAQTTTITLKELYDNFRTVAESRGKSLDTLHAQIKEAQATIRQHKIERQIWDSKEQGYCKEIADLQGANVQKEAVIAERDAIIAELRDKLNNREYVVRLHKDFVARIQAEERRKVLEEVRNRFCNSSLDEWAQWLRENAHYPPLGTRQKEETQI